MGNAKNLDRLLDKFTAGDIPGCALAVMQNDEVIYEGYSGYADVENRIPVTEHSIFRQASTTKLFTYAIGMMLYEEGKFLFTDPVYEYLPEWRDTKKVIHVPGIGPKIVPVEHPVTIRDAFAMTCGYPYMFRADFTDEANLTLTGMARALTENSSGAKYTTVRDEVRSFAEAPAMFEPGTHWQYGIGSEIVGAVIEEITGKSVRRNMLERLIEPMGLKDTATLLDEEMMSRLVKCYRVTPGGEKTAFPPEEDDILRPGVVPEGARANLNCSAKDFTAFMSMLANGGRYKGERYLSRHTIDLMRTNQLCPDAMKDFHAKNGVDILGYGYGLGVRTLMDRAEGCANGTPGAFGWSGGYGSWAESSPENRMAVVYMHNTQGLRNEYYHMLVRSAVYGMLE